MNRIIVCLKQAVDVSQLKVDPKTRNLIIAGAPMKISDFDKNALEAALKIKETIGNVEIVTLTITAKNAKTVMREALAMGADKAYLVNEEDLDNISTSGTAYVLAEAIKKIGNFDLILCGETSLDGFSGLVGPRLSELLKLPIISSVRNITVKEDSVIAERSLENSYETVKAKYPALIMVTREINQPRIPSLMMIMKASKKEIINFNLTDLNIPKEAIQSNIDIIEVKAPTSERKKIILTGENVDEIANKLAKALIKEGVIG